MLVLAVMDVVMDIIIDGVSWYTNNVLAVGCKVGENMILPHLIRKEWEKEVSIYLLSH